MRIARNYKKILLATLLVFTTLSNYGLASDTKAVAVTEEEVEKSQITTTDKTTAAGQYLSDPGVVTLKKDGSMSRNTANNLNDNFLVWIRNQLVSQQLRLVDENGEQVTTKGGANVYINNPGALASVLNMNDSMRNNPSASGIVYAQGEWNKIAHGYKAKAASTTDSWVYYPGLGFTILNPVQKYWIVSRNIAYIAMIFIMVLVAFLVAFRSNFGGQTQVTIANSIPNIILALVMISISFPLSGFAIDIITIGTNAAQQVLVQNTFSPGYEDVWNKDSISTLWITPTSFDPGSSLANPKNNLQPDDEAMSVWQIFSTSNVNLLDKDETAVASIIPNQSFVGTIMENILKDAASTGIANLFFQLVFVIAAFMASLKLFFKLLTKYLTLILYPIISPFLMLSVAIPGRGTKTITGYFKTLLSAALSFIAVYAVFLFIIVLGHDTGLNPGTGQSITGLNYMPPLLGYSSVDSGTGAMLSDYLKMLLAFGLFLATPAIPDVIDQSLNITNFNEIRSGQALRSQILQGADTQGRMFMNRPGGVAGGITGARNLVGNVWRRGEGALGYDTEKEQKK